MCAIDIFGGMLALVDSGAFKEVVGLSRRGVGIRVAGIRGKVRAVFVLNRILRTLGLIEEMEDDADLFRAHEEEMLYGMSHAGHVLLIREVTDIDIESSTSLVCLVVMHEKGFKLVRQLYYSVLSVVRFRLLEGVGYSAHWMHDCRKGSGIRNAV